MAYKGSSLYVGPNHAPHGPSIGNSGPALNCRWKEEESWQQKNGDTVKVDLYGKFEDGTVFDSSAGRDPMEFTIGQGQVIPGFENAIVGMELGDAKTTTIQASDAYGEHNKELLLVVERNKLPQDLNPSVGEQLELRRPDGQAILVTIAEVSDASITLDANHPLAGKNLVFDIQLKEIA